MGNYKGRIYARYRTPGNRTVIVVAEMPLLRNGYQCDGCWHVYDDVDRVEDIDDKARVHASRCTGRGPQGRTYEPAYWGLI
ncbi:hypothetical protein [Streptomyces sp. NPDC060027]|uniref:hypothetical protein n=1 Tax=Streptomyces sp. NPDC060027 TaxID=3347040 RepID=UPI00368A54C3